MEEKQTAADLLQAEVDSLKETNASSLAFSDNIVQQLDVLQEKIAKKTEEVEEMQSQFKEEKEKLLMEKTQTEQEKEEYSVKFLQGTEQLIKEQETFAKAKEDMTQAFAQERKQLLKEREQLLKEKEEMRAQFAREKEEMLRDLMPAEKHGEMVAEIQTAFEVQKKAEIAEALETVKKQHEEELRSLEEKKAQELQQHTLSMQASRTAEKQTRFNEALNKAVSEKERTIQELKATNLKLTEQLQQLHAGQAMSMKVEWGKQQASDEGACGGLDAQQQSAFSTSMLQSSMMQSVVPVADLPPHERLSELEQLVKSKDEELTKMLEKMNELSMTRSSQVLAQDKVSITTCNRGDVVLLCLDERHDHYVVFTVGTMLHFLHSDCLPALGLKTAPGEARKSWVLAEIVEKEYCQAKKPNNRFNVPVGTKFYRVKARPWEKEVRSSGTSSFDPSTSSKPSGASPSKPSSSSSSSSPAKTR